MKKTDKFNFAEDFKELEGIVEWFESQEVDLEEGLKRFERGLELAKRCRSRLKEVENKVVQIKAKFADTAPDATDPAEDEPAVPGSDQARLL